MTIRVGHLVLVTFALVAMVVPAQQRRPPTASISSLPPMKQAAVDAAISKWNRQFKWMAQNNSDGSITGASFQTINLGSPSEKDLVVTERSGCSPTGNCRILILRPVRDGYLVVLDGIGQSYTTRRTLTKGYHDIELAMHGSATITAVKVYKFNGSRYLRSSCHQLNFEILNNEGNFQKLEKPQVTPCR